MITPAMEPIGPELPGQKVLEMYPDPLLLISSAGKILGANTEAGKLFGYGLDELVGSNLDILLPRRFREVHATHMRLFFRRPVQRPMGTGMEIFGLTRGGKEIPLDISLLPYNGTAVLAAVRDITDIRKMQEELDNTKKALLSLQHFASTANKVAWLVLGSVVGQVVVYLVTQIFKK